MSTGPEDATAAPVVCAACGVSAAPGSRFCEGCGAPLVAGVAATAPSAPPAGSAPPGPPPLPSYLDHAPISAPTRRPAGTLPDPPAPTRRPCAECGGEVGPDLYCQVCGTKAPSERDHFVEQPAPWVAGVCDKAVRKTRNEDAMALLAGQQPGSRAVLVVMDGVSNSIDSDVASLAGARAAREVLRMPLPAGMGTPAGRDAAVAKVLADATAAANNAIVAVTDPDSPNPASATFTAVVVEGARLTWANIGDSRSYWLPDDGEPLQLTTDDSLAQQQIAAGMAREVAENGPQAHAITRWLGRDSEGSVPTVGALEVSTPGWVLACSDGLWNYASTPQAIADQVRAAAGDAGGAADPLAVADALVGFANAAGGHDNITAALARLDPAGLGHNADIPAGSPESPAPDHGGVPSDG